MRGVGYRVGTFPGGWLHGRYTSLHSFVSVGVLLAGALFKL